MIEYMLKTSIRITKVQLIQEGNPEGKTPEGVRDRFACDDKREWMS